jgi:Trypsin-like peptidase domain
MPRRSLQTLLILLTTALAGLSQLARAASPYQLSGSVVRLISHGCSGTVIHTEPGRSFILTCAHAFAGPERTKRIVLDVPATQPTQPATVGIQLVEVDYDADLALLLLRAGPLEFVTPVGPDGHRCRGHQLLSVGYDAMRMPAVQVQAHLVSADGKSEYTAERPIPGRSGGALFDVTDGYLVGVVSGYEILGPRRGIYVSHQAILGFLKRVEGKPVLLSPVPVRQPLPVRPAPRVIEWVTPAPIPCPT